MNGTKAGKSEQTVRFEAAEYRSDFSKTFRLSDGSYTSANYTFPVHYRSSDGEYAEIRNVMARKES